MKKLVTMLLALVLVLSTMLGCLPASAEGEYKDTIVWVIGNDQDTLDPQMNVNKFQGHSAILRRPARL